MTYSCLLVPRAYLRTEDVSRVLQSSVFFSDVVYLPATSRADPRLDASAKAFAEETLRGLRELGAVKFWSAEGDQVGADDEPHLWEADHTLDYNRRLELYHEITERLMDNRNKFLQGSVPEPFDGITELVIGKHVLWWLALQEQLETEGILLEPEAARNTMQYFDALRRPQIATEAVREIAIRLHLPDLSQLTMEQIADIRALMPGFRDALMAKISALERPFTDTPSVIDDIAHAVVEQYLSQAETGSIRSKRPFLPDPKSSRWTAAMLRIPVLGSVMRSRFLGWTEAGEPDKAPDLLLLRRLRTYGSAATAPSLMQD
jgi:hypothetical protein